MLRSLSFSFSGYYKSLYILVNHRLPSSLEYSDAPSVPLASTLLEHILKPLHFTYSSCTTGARYGSKLSTNATTFTNVVAVYGLKMLCNRKVERLLCLSGIYVFLCLGQTQVHLKKTVCWCQILLLFGLY